MSAKDIKALVKRLRRQGWEAVVSGSGHWKLTSPDGERMTCSMSPSDRHAYANACSDARKLGAEV